MNRPRQKHRQPQIRIVDPGVTPLGPPRIVGEGTSARVAKPSRQLLRAARRLATQAEKR